MANHESPAKMKKKTNSYRFSTPPLPFFGGGRGRRRWQEIVFNEEQ